MNEDTMRFNIDLSDDTNTIAIDFKQLGTKGNEIAKNDCDVPKAGNRNNNILEKLERRYGAMHEGRYENSEEEELSTEDSNGENDFYDSEDSFIDDEEICKTIELQKKNDVDATLHSGFFVHDNTEIETIEASKNVVKKVKKKPKLAVASKDQSASVKAFISEHGDAGRAFTVNEAFEKAYAALKIQADEYYKQNPTVGRSFPRELDDALRKVDAIVVGEHAQSWRINPYFAKLMQVLPYTKNCLKGSMVRLEARDAAMEARRAMDQAFTSVITSVKSNQTATPMTKATADKIQSSHPFARSLYLYFQAEDKYIIAENAYRKLMQAVDKKTASQADFLPLQPKTERTASYNKILILFPTGFSDLSKLRAASKAGKNVNPKKKPIDKQSNSPLKAKSIVKPIKSRRTVPCPKYKPSHFTLLSVK